MLYHIYYFLVAIIEIFCCMLFFDIFLKDMQQKQNKKKASLVFFMSCIEYICTIFLAQFYILRAAAIIIIMIAVFMIYYKYNLKKITVLTICYQGIIAVFDVIAYIIIYILAYNEKIVGTDYMLQEVVAVLFSKFFLLLCIMTIKIIAEQKQKEIALKTEWIPFFLFQLILVIVFAVILSFISSTDNQQFAHIFFLTVMCVTGLNLMVFYMMKRDEKKRQNILSQMQIQNEIEKYYAISENYNHQQKKVHEFKNQIMCIQSLLSVGEYEEAFSYVNKINQTTVSQVHLINTNHVIVNAVINTKYQEASNKNIVVVFKGNDLSDIKLKNEDIVIILSNLFNNAIEACEKCTKKKRIKINLEQTKREFIISVKNTYEQKLFIENGEYKTTKEKETQGHGIGIKNIIRTIEKYHGEYAISHDDNEFQFSIIIPNIK